MALKRQIGKNDKKGIKALLDKAKNPRLAQKTWNQIQNTSRVSVFVPEGYAGKKMSHFQIRDSISGPPEYSRVYEIIPNRGWSSTSYTCHRANLPDDQNKGMRDIEDERNTKQDFDHFGDVLLYVQKQIQQDRSRIQDNNKSS